MDDQEFDRIFVAAAFRQIGENGWRRLSLVEAALAAGLPIGRVRARFPARSAVLMRFGSLADQAALADVDSSGVVKDRLFGMIMRRIDVLQAHRAGVLNLLRSLPGDPMTALMLNCASLVSMGWLLDAAGVGGLSGSVGLLRRKGLLAVWLWTVNAWRSDESADLSATMAALDQALSRAETASSWLPDGGTASRTGNDGIEAGGASAPFEPPDAVSE